MKILKQTKPKRPPINQANKKPHHHHSKLFWFNNIMAKFTACSLMNRKK